MVKYTFHIQTQSPLMKVKIKEEYYIHPELQHLPGETYDW